jgi:hypothetical protein
MLALSRPLELICKLKRPENRGEKSATANANLISFRFKLNPFQGEAKNGNENKTEADTTVVLLELYELVHQANWNGK